PDFMFLLKSPDGSRTLNLVLETKDKTELDPEEKRKVRCAEKLFGQMQKDDESLRFICQLNVDKIAGIIEELF
ncbi:MAG: hypothetical protein K2O67_05430, partial [Clostridia bacterium]|nr:hypothetical protein [Clostridia bacterium]